MTYFFDMDGTIADLYSVENWLPALESGKTLPFEKAKTIGKAAQIAKAIRQLQRKGGKVGIISWTSKSGEQEFQLRIKAAKLKWLQQHFPSVKWDKIHILPYGTPKSLFKGDGDVLFDDEERNRRDWKGLAFEPEKILEVLKEAIRVG